MFYATKDSRSFGVFGSLGQKFLCLGREGEGGGGGVGDSHGHLKKTGVARRKCSKNTVKGILFDGRGSIMFLPLKGTNCKQHRTYFVIFFPLNTLEGLFRFQHLKRYQSTNFEPRKVRRTPQSFLDRSQPLPLGFSFAILILVYEVSAYLDFYSLYHILWRSIFDRHNSHDQNCNTFHSE